MTRLFPRTLKLKVRSESYHWLDAAAIEVNQVFNYCNDISFATKCGDWHDRDVNAARNMLGFGSRCWTSVSGNESLQEQLLVGPEFSFRARRGRSSAQAVA